MKRREDLSTPRQGPSLGVHYDPEAFGNFSEAIARTLGTARFLVIQTVVVIAWILLNVIGWLGKWDPYPFILLNLAFSTQAAYAAPLILLAQNRQADRDRIQQEQDRLVNRAGAGGHRVPGSRDRHRATVPLGRRDQRRPERRRRSAQDRDRTTGLKQAGGLTPRPRPRLQRSRRPPG